MQSDELIIVSGFGRCGTSLVMQMLHAGGIRCVGQWPAFEDEWTARHHNSAEWMAHAMGRAIKLLDPHRHVPPRDLPARGIWLDRSPREQAKSIAKLNHLLSGHPAPNRRIVRGYERGLITDRPAAMRALLQACAVDCIALSFEDLIRYPEALALRLVDFLAITPRVAAAERMASVVRPRGIGCYDGLLEVDLLDSAGGSAHGALTLGVST